MSISKIFIPNFVRVLTNKRKYIENNVYSVDGVMPQGWDLGCWGGSKTLAWGFAMAPHRLRILVFFIYFTLYGAALLKSPEMSNFAFYNQDGRKTGAQKDRIFGK